MSSVQGAEPSGAKVLLASVVSKEKSAPLAARSRSRASMILPAAKDTSSGRNAESPAAIALH